MVPAVSVQNPPQSVAEGMPFPVAPPTVSSLIDVNVIGDPLVPTACSVPVMSIAEPLPHHEADLTIAPGWTVIVTPAGTVRQSGISHGVVEAVESLRRKTTGRLR